MSRPPLTPLAASLPDTVPFVSPEAHERQLGRAFGARIGANESVFGPSPMAIDAMARELPEAWKYPDNQSHDLRSALAAHHGVPVESVAVGVGIDGLLGSLVRLTVAQGDPVVTSRGAYPTFNYHVTGFGGVLHSCDFRDDHEDIDALLSLAAETQAKLVYLSNPDNPMGSWHGAERVAAMIDALPHDSLLVLDEAYHECSDEDLSPPIDPQDRRVIRMRTFSKAYGLAGIRVGYAIGHPDLIGAFNKVRDHFGISRVSQAGALAALADQTYLREVTARIAESRAEIGRIARENGGDALPSATNFVAVDLGCDGAFTGAVLEHCHGEGVFVRMPGVAPLDRCLRISCGGPDEMTLLAEVLPRALKAARAN